ncbi:MAG: DUF2384 domain-containing protein [Planctomycetes bacterium]|nr:DUF2384 domain-containing protein [Planctomycetota bacterium]
MARTPVGAIVEALGGSRVWKKRITSLADLKREIRAGFPFPAFLTLLETFALSQREICHALNLTERTMARRKLKKRLTADESDKLVRLARIAALAAEVLGTTEKAIRWLRRQNRALGNVTPLALLDTEVGAREVEETLGRIEHGVYG